MHIMNIKLVNNNKPFNNQKIIEQEDYSFQGRSQEFVQVGLNSFRGGGANTH